ncbi:hypothetical protein IF188_10915 [Microbacterium sp. NEAU-LLC]|uniref:Excreted virulence factor EspC, type VII ESX diderm n=1 Tax=Microbacterium helvum TaxID=2773713 RepID=A0ABR8NT46_9MICO|nr:DUF6507 family protein [Microbacterium helvum]MBD3942206.1 hypothetical protein [Microbacterium helvum]
MTSWSIDPTGVARVLTDVSPYSEALGASLNSLSGVISAAVNATQSPAISEAVSGYFEVLEGPRIQSMSTRIQSAVGGVLSATEAYIQGDLEMAATQQQANIAAVYPSMPGVEGGY